MMSGIICCACSLSAISVLQFALKQWRNDHSEIVTNDEPYCKDAVARIVLDFRKPGEEKLRKSKNHGVLLLKKTDWRDPTPAAIERLHLTTIIMSNS